jgi:hypothetical protein
VFYVFFQVQSECLCDFSRVSWAVPVLRGVCAVASKFMRGSAGFWCLRMQALQERAVGIKGGKRERAWATAPRAPSRKLPANSGFREVKPNRTWARPTELGHVPSFVNRNTLRVSVIHRRVSRRVQKSPEDARGRASTPRVVARFCRYSRCRPPRAGLILKHSACCRAVLQVYCFRSPAAVPLSPPWSEVLRLEEDVSSLLFCLLVCVRGHPSMPPVVCVYESTIPSHHLLTPRAAASCGDPYMVDHLRKVVALVKARVKTCLDF